MIGVSCVLAGLNALPLSSGSNNDALLRRWCRDWGVDFDKEVLVYLDVFGKCVDRMT